MRSGKVWILFAVLALALVLMPVLASASVVETMAAKGKPVQIDTECPLDGNTTPLFAGQHIEVGSVEMSYLGDQLTVKYMTNGTGEPDYLGWYLREVHLYVGVEPPGTNAPGQFPYAYDEFGLWETEFSFVIDLTEIEGYEPGDCLYIAAHAVVERFEYYESDLDGFAAVLPESVNMSVAYPGGDSYFNTTVSGGTSLDGTYDGFCIDTDNFISPGTGYTANVYSSYESLPDGLVEYPQNLDLVNWVINQGFVGTPAVCDGGNFTFGDVQVAIWNLIEDTDPPSYPPFTDCHVEEIVDAAYASGEGFVPGCDESVAVILVPVDAVQITIAQVTFAELEVPCVPVFSDETAWGYGECEFGRGWGTYFYDCPPEEVCVDFSGIDDGGSVEGSDIFENVTISTPTGGAVALFPNGTKSTYGAPNDACPDSTSIPNGCMDEELGGFADVTAKNNGAAHSYTFTFGSAVEEFSLRMLDYGDYNIKRRSRYIATITAYAADNSVVDSFEYKFATSTQLNPTVSDFGDLLCGNGDACDASEGMPGKFTWKVNGTGITRVELIFDGTAAYDPNIAFDNLCFAR